METFDEDVFFKNDGYPTERYEYCNYYFFKNESFDLEYSRDYDQFMLVTNALYPFIRLSKKRGRFKYPCGGSSKIAADSSYAKETCCKRDEMCPKIAWGIAALFLANIHYDEQQKDYVLNKERQSLFEECYNKYWNLYQLNHNGLKYSNIPIAQKELNYIEEHTRIIRAFWEKSTPLKTYPTLYDYAYSVEKGYEEYLKKKEQSIKIKMMNKDNIFSTETRDSFDKPYVKVFF
ncbi:MAG: hypothetical protein E7070_07875 [Bacteroidales bacterium]|jgi:hypothetical protein|nr:hypothetical protein [Bacteroidales bacterium]